MGFRFTLGDKILLLLRLPVPQLRESRSKESSISHLDVGVGPDPLWSRTRGLGRRRVSGSPVDPSFVSGLFSLSTTTYSLFLPPSFCFISLGSQRTAICLSLRPDGCQEGHGFIPP